jgi:hypothetical protein
MLIPALEWLTLLFYRPLLIPLTALGGFLMPDALIRTILANFEPWCAIRTNLGENGVCLM